MTTTNSTTHTQQYTIQERIAGRWQGGIVAGLSADENRWNSHEEADSALASLASDLGWDVSPFAPRCEARAAVRSRAPALPAAEFPRVAQLQ